MVNDNKQQVSPKVLADLFEAIDSDGLWNIKVKDESEENHPTIEFEMLSDLGEDFSFSINYDGTFDDAVEQIRSYYADFDVDEQMDVIYRNHHTKQGFSLSQALENAEDIDSRLSVLVDRVEDARDALISENSSIFREIETVVSANDINFYCNLDDYVEENAEKSPLIQLLVENNLVPEFAETLVDQLVQSSTKEYNWYQDALDAEVKHTIPKIAEEDSFEHLYDNATEKLKPKIEIEDINPEIDKNSLTLFRIKIPFTTIEALQAAGIPLSVNNLAALDDNLGNFDNLDYFYDKMWFGGYALNNAIQPAVLRVLIANDVDFSDVFDISEESLNLSDVRDGVIDFGKGEFVDLAHSKEVIIPQYCSLPSLNIGVDNKSIYKITEIWDDAFAGNENIEKLIIPEGVVAIGQHTFEGCVNLKDVVLPESLLALDNGTFAGCKSLTYVSFPSHEIEMRADTFVGTPIEAILIDDYLSKPVGIYLDDIPFLTPKGKLAEEVLRINNERGLIDGDTVLADKMADLTPADFEISGLSTEIIKAWENTPEAYRGGIEQVFETLTKMPFDEFLIETIEAHRDAIDYETSMGYEITKEKPSPSVHISAKDILNNAMSASKEQDSNHGTLDQETKNSPKGDR